MKGFAVIAVLVNLQILYASNVDTGKSKCPAGSIPVCPNPDPEFSVFFPHENDCHWFFHCSNGAAYCKECPAELHWNAELDTCDYPENAGCVGNKPDVCPPGAVPVCPNPDPEFSVFFPHENDCHWFFHCSNGVAYCKVCPAGLHWNTELDTCDWPENAGCEGKTPALTTNRPTLPPVTCNTGKPTRPPITRPTFKPTKPPITRPTFKPTRPPITRPTFKPTKPPITRPTFKPTKPPITRPTFKPTKPPITRPTFKPTKPPITRPTFKPTKPPITRPTFKPTKPPITRPTFKPTRPPITRPTFKPTKPTYRPTPPPTTKKPTITEDPFVCPPGAIPQCPNPDPEFSVFFPHENDCHYFYHCSNGVAYCKVCPAGLHWNTELDTCDWPENAGCVSKPSDPCPPGAIPTCPNPDPAFSVFFPHANDCHWFFHCSNGEAYCKECPAGLHWNTKLDTCDWPQDAGCA